MGLTNIISATDFTKEDLNQIFDLADRYAHSNYRPRPLKDKRVALYFGEPSTRTRGSFEAAIDDLGGHSMVFTEESSSAAKGESLEDTARMLSQYADAIVVRHKQNNAARIMSWYASVPVINAGNGTHEHPTQALLDIYTLQQEFVELNGLTIALVGDLCNGRTVHSLVYLLNLYKDIQLLLVSPLYLSMPGDIRRLIHWNGNRCVSGVSLDEALRVSQVVYMTRIQKERMDPEVYEDLKHSYILTPEDLRVYPKDSMFPKIMHPLPRVDEIHPDVDRDPRAIYFKQAANALPVRKALLTLLLR